MQQPPSGPFIGCDGVFERLTNEEVGGAVDELAERGTGHEEIANIIVRAALNAGSGDNITAMVFGSRDI